ncbi:MAG: SGNH/GDSL hydrolase family protein [Chlamydiales bacterium]
MKTILLILSALMMFSCAKKKPDAHYKVLIIGDSISEGYTTQLQLMQLPSIDIIHNQNPGMDGTNARDTQHGVEQIDYWLDKAGDVDLVSYNQGMWDMCPDLPVTYHPVDQYKINLGIIIDKIQARGLRVIFMKNSYAPKNSCRAPYVDQYNEAAVEVMTAKGVLVYDLYTVAYENRDLLMNHDGYGDVHFTPAGFEKLAEYVLAAIQENL